MIERIPKDYDGLKPTGRKIEDMLPSMLAFIQDSQQRSIEILETCWNEIVGKKISESTKVYNYQKVVLYIKVKNATLLSILSSQEKRRLMHNLKEKLPNIELTNLVFQFG